MTYFEIYIEDIFEWKLLSCYFKDFYIKYLLIINFNSFCSGFVTFPPNWLALSSSLGTDGLKHNRLKKCQNLIILQLDLMIFVYNYPACYYNFSSVKNDMEELLEIKRISV